MCVCFSRVNMNVEWVVENIVRKEFDPNPDVDGTCS